MGRVFRSHRKPRSCPVLPNAGGDRETRLARVSLQEVQGDVGGGGPPQRLATPVAGHTRDDAQMVGLGTVSRCWSLGSRCRSVTSTVINLLSKRV